MQEEKAEWLIYVTDEGQAGHFKQVFGAGKKAGIIPAEKAPRIDHVGFGLVLGEDGKRIRTRSSGEVCAVLSWLMACGKELISILVEHIYGMIKAQSQMKIFCWGI